MSVDEGDGGGDGDGAFEDPNIDVVYEDTDEAMNARDDIVGEHFETPEEIDAFINNSAGRPMFSSLLLDGNSEIEVYEADIDFVVRYCIDAGFKPEECVRVRPGAQVTTMPLKGENTHAFMCDWSALERVDEEEAQNFIPPQVCLSFDCEMELGRDNAFPKPETERILQAGCVFFDPVADPKCEHPVRRGFVIGRSELEGFERDEILSFSDDMHLTSALADFMRVVQPDMITGWNIENFDLNYIFERAKIRRRDNEILTICRRPGVRMRMRDRQFQSSAHGTHVYKEATAEGVWIWDLYQAFKRSTTFKLRSYSLEYVSNTFLGDRKEDVAYSAINGLQRTPKGRCRLITYCMKDAVLPARLIGKMSMLIENIEMARMTGVPLDMVCRRGLQIRLKSYLYSKGKEGKIFCWGCIFRNFKM
jgi:DNA polymerase delta subunit 1